MMMKTTRAIEPQQQRKPTLAFRQLNESDIGQMVQLQRDFGDGRIVLRDEKWLSKLFLDKQKAFGAYVDGVLSGQVVLTIEEKPINRLCASFRDAALPVKIGHIGTFVVAHGQRGRGIGNVLLGKCEEAALKADCAATFGLFETDPKSGSLHAFIGRDYALVNVGKSPERDATVYTGLKTAAPLVLGASRIPPVKLRDSDAIAALLASGHIGRLHNASTGERSVLMSECRGWQP